MTLQNEKFEELISRQLNAELEPQRGKAAAAFRAHIAADAVPASIPLVQPKSRRKMMYWSAVPTLIAACVAVVVTVQMNRGGAQKVVDPVPAGGVTVNVAATQPPKTGSLVFDAPVDQIFVTQHVPGGVILSDATPLRLVRQEEPRMARMIDPNDRTVPTLSQPIERATYVEIRP